MVQNIPTLLYVYLPTIAIIIPQHNSSIMEQFDSGKLEPAINNKVFPFFYLIDCVRKEE